MTLHDAWVVTALGMAVVFVGLVLCIAFIQLFSRVARNIAWGQEGSPAHGDFTAPPVVPALSPGATLERPGLPPSEVVPDEVLAVIAAVLEIDQQLYFAKPGSRLTIRRVNPLYVGR